MNEAARMTSKDIDILQDILVKKDHIIEQKSVVIEQQKQRIQELEEYLRLARQKQFGRSSEKEKHPGQGELFNEAELVDDTIDDDVPPIVDQDHTDKPKKKKPRRKGFSEQLAREQIYIDLPDDEKVGAIDTFYSKVKEELDIEPAKVRVLEYLQEKAVFVEGGQRQVKNAPLPKHPLPKSMASIGLLAFIIISKYMDGLPLYRLEGILKRYGGDVTRTSMANWIIRLARQCQPLIHLMRAHQHSGTLIQMDETRIQVHKEPGYSATGNKYMWVTLGGPPGQPSIIFDYDPSRDHDVPLRLLDGYSGALQSDGYAGYDAVVSKFNLEHLGCMDHCRRKFKETQAAQPKQTQGQSKADIALAKIGQLYMIERKIKSLSREEKYRQRQEESVPILNDLKQWMNNNLGKSPKDSLLSKALVYMRNQWPKLIRYCDDGDFPISNIRAENAVRPFVIGRKNWLFADTPKGAHASGVFYSLIETAKANEIDPYAYLRHIFKQLPHADTLDQVEALLPWNVKDQLPEFQKKH